MNDDEQRKPRCFGDPSEHSQTDPTCRRCVFEQTCGIIVRSKLREESKKQDRSAAPPAVNRPAERGGKIPKPPDPEDYTERDDESAGFFGALFFNAAMSALRAGLVEATFASDQIPRFPYPDPFRAAFKRGREEDEK